MSSALWFAECNIHEVAIRRLQVIHEHSTPYQARSCALQPRDIIVHDVLIDMAVVVVVAETHGNRATIAIDGSTVVLRKLQPTCRADRHLAGRTQCPVERRLLELCVVHFRLRTTNVFAAAKQSTLMVFVMHIQSPPRDMAISVVRTFLQRDFEWLCQ